MSRDLEPGAGIIGGVVYRRIPPWPNYTKGNRSTSLAYLPDSEEMSISASLSRETVLKGFPDYGVTEVSVALLRELGFIVRFDPTDDDPNHVDISGDFRESKRRRLSRSSEMLAAPKFPADEQAR
jgi:hypothetical protein